MSQPDAAQPAPEPTPVTRYDSPVHSSISGGAWNGGVTSPAATTSPATTGEGSEDVGRGLLVALGAVLAAGVLSVVVWNLGFVASITSFVLAAGATYGYTWAAGSAPRRGIVPLVVLILLGIVATFLAFIGWDAAQYYDTDPSVAAAGLSKSDFVTRMMTDGDVVGGYAGDLALYFLFAVLGTFGTLRMLFARRG